MNTFIFWMHSNALQFHNFGRQYECCQNVIIYAGKRTFYLKKQTVYIGIAKMMLSTRCKTCFKHAFHSYVFIQLGKPCK